MRVLKNVPKPGDLILVDHQLMTVTGFDATRNLVTYTKDYAHKDDMEEEVFVGYQLVDDWTSPRIFRKSNDLVRWEASYRFSHRLVRETVRAPSVKAARSHLLYTLGARLADGKYLRPGERVRLAKSAISHSTADAFEPSMIKISPLTQR